MLVRTQVGTEVDKLPLVVENVTIPSCKNANPSLPGDAKSQEAANMLKSVKEKSINYYRIKCLYVVNCTCQMIQHTVQRSNRVGTGWIFIF